MASKQDLVSPIFRNTPPPWIPHSLWAAASLLHSQPRMGKNCQAPGRDPHSSLPSASAHSSLPFDSISPARMHFLRRAKLLKTSGKLSLSKVFDLSLTFDTNVCSLILSFYDNTPDFPPLFWLLLFHPHLNVHLPRGKRWPLFGPYSPLSPSVAPFLMWFSYASSFKFTLHTSELQVRIFSFLIHISSWMFYDDQSAN